MRAKPERHRRYGRLLEMLAEAEHRSGLLVTSRELPPELGLRGGEPAAVRVMELGGLGSAEGRALLRDKGLRGDDAAWESLVARYGGNGLALKIVGESIHQAFLQEVEAQDASLAGSDLADSVLAAALHYPTCLALSADGSRLIAGIPTGEVCIWLIGDRKLLAPLHGHTGAVSGVAVSDAGRLLASGSHDGTIRLWDIGSGRPVLTLDGAGGPVWSVALSPDGRVVARGSVDGAVKLWDVASGQLLASLSGHTAGVGVVALDTKAQPADCPSRIQTRTSKAGSSRSSPK